MKLTKGERIKFALFIYQTLSQNSYKLLYKLDFFYGYFI
jgi:hypothetical protein